MRERFEKTDCFYNLGYEIDFGVLQYSERVLREYGKISD